MATPRIRNLLHESLLLTQKAGRLPWPWTALAIVLAALLFGVTAGSAPAALWLALWALADWLLLASLPRRGLAYGTVQPTHVALLALRWFLTWAAEALLALDEGTPEAPAVSDQLGLAVHALAALCRIDASLSEQYLQAELALDGLAEIARDLRDYVERIEYSPRRLEAIEERLDLIQNLKRKYGGAVEAVMAFGESARQQLDTITHAGERIAELEEDERRLLQILSEKGQALSKQRHAVAGELSRAVEAELNDLRMAGARFAVDIQTRGDPDGVPVEGGRRLAFDASGFDRVEFLIAPNPGEGLKPLARTASGGETSRLMLALKNVLARADYVPTLIFDEIDQGIGGRVGLVVGQKLWRLARQHQVLCVTHLPQLAAYGDQHFRVTKLVAQGRTSTQVEPLTGDARREELAQMLGGISEGTLRSAGEILDAAQEQEKSI